MNTPHTIDVQRRLAGGVDAHGNPVESWGDMLPLPCYFIAPGAMDEPGASGRDVSVVLYTVGAPAHPNLPDEYDRVLLGGAEFKVHGRPSNWNLGPFGYAPGVTFELTRTEG